MTARTVTIGTALSCVLALIAFSVPSAQQANASVKPLDEAPPADFGADVGGRLAPKGWRLEAGGATFADVWPVKTLSLTIAATGAVPWSAIAEGTLLGALRAPSGGSDFRGRKFQAGYYTLRYGIQPQDGNHLGVSSNREFALASPAAKDVQADPIEHDALVLLSRQTVGVSHPAIFNLVPPPAGAAGSLFTTAEGYAGVVLEFACKPPSGAAPPFRTGLIFVGRSTE